MDLFKRKCVVFKEDDIWTSEMPNILGVTVDLLIGDEWKVAFDMECTVALLKRDNVKLVVSISFFDEHFKLL